MMIEGAVQIASDTQARRPPASATGSREQHYTVKQVAEDWGVSENTVRSLFSEEEGVLKITSPRASLTKSVRKAHTSLRISGSARERVYSRLSSGFASQLKATGRGVK